VALLGRSLHLTGHNCGIIFCCCHEGQTAAYIQQLAAAQAYTLVWTAPYTLAAAHAQQDEDSMNAFKAQHLAAFI
jgi:hypothetical protein